jgi:DNA-binding MarR family transcriptional regulator
MNTPQASDSRLAAPASLEDLLLYRLSRLQACAGAVVVRWCEGRYGITRREWHILGILAARGPMGSSQLAAHTRLDRPRTSRAISALQAKGLLARRTPRGDARQVSVALTARGEALHRELFPVVSGLNLDLLSVLEPAEVQLFEGMLARLHARAEAVAGQSELPSADRRRGGTRRLASRESLHA